MTRFDCLPNIQQVNFRDAEDLEQIDLLQLKGNTIEMEIDKHIPDISSVNSGSEHSWQSFIAKQKWLLTMAFLFIKFTLLFKALKSHERWSPICHTWSLSDDHKISKSSLCAISQWCYC